MSAFTASELEYLQRMTMGRLATVGADGQPHVIPVTFHYNAARDAIDIGGVDFAAGKKWRDLQKNRKVTVLVDDANPQGARAIEIRGEAELHPSGGDKINPRFANFVPQFIRIRPHFIVSWGLEEPGFHPFGRAVERPAAVRAKEASS
jgi:pyridoxamine 5'-phosphate oxidase family protein